MLVQVTQDTEFGSVVDLLVEMVEYERGLGTLGVSVSDGSQGFPPGSCGQFVEQVLPEMVRAVQDGKGFRCGWWRWVVPLEPAGWSLYSKPLRLPLRSVVFDQVP
jgi:hypothetical protein